MLYTHPNGKEHKLRPEHSGPYQVMNRLNDIYSIQDLVSGKVIDTHVHLPRPFNCDPDRTRSVDIARQTAQEFLIRDILAHRGVEIEDPRWNSWWDGKTLAIQSRGSYMQDSDMQRNCMSTCGYIRCDR